MPEGKDIVLYGADGRPIERALIMDNDEGIVGFSTFLRHLFETDYPPERRARDPYATHPWVYAAASAIADNLSQVPFIVFEETEAEKSRRARRAVERGLCKSVGLWVPPRGRRRTALQRHLLRKERFSGRRNRSVEVNFDHRFSSVLSRPNEYMSGTTLWKVTDTLFSINGEAFWWLRTPSGRPYMPGDEIEDIFPLHPADMYQVIDSSDGELGAWEYHVTARSEGLGVGRPGQHIRFMPTEILHFRDIDPNYMLRGMSKLASAAGSIKQDLSAIAHNSSILENNADPGGIISYEDQLDEKIRRRIAKKWHDKHGGPLNRRKIAVLDSGGKWQATAMSMEDLQFGELRTMNREEILAVLRATKSVMGITEDLNFATQLSQDRNFWNKALLPRVKVYESVIEHGMFFTEPDTEFAGFKLEDVDALQEDLSKKVETANVMANQWLHVPPRVAFELVGIDIEQYEGDDVAFVPPVATSVEKVLEMEDEPDMQVDPLTGLPLNPGAQPAPGDDNDNPDARDPQAPQPEKGDAPNDRPDVGRGLVASRAGFNIKEFAARQKKNRRKIVDAWGRSIEQFEPGVQRAYKGHVASIRRETLDNFDVVFPAAKGAVVREMELTPEQIEDILFNAQRAGVDLSARAFPLYQAMMESAIQFSTDELGGLYNFDIMDPEVQRFMNRKAVMIKGVDRRLRTAVRREISESIKAGEGPVEARKRIARVFNRAVSASRLTTIARTESAQMMGGVREIIHDKEGVALHEWTTAGDEYVREDHVVLGQSGSQERGFNYMELLGRPDEVLRYPADVSGPPDQVINCRCVTVPVG